MKLTRSKKAVLNSASSLIYQIIAIICGFVLPRLFLLYYGSETNGLVASITQFLGFITLAECGVGAVVQSTLYKPLAHNDTVLISKIVISSDRFFKRIAYVLLGYTAVLMVCYPLITDDSFDFLFTFSLILIISLSSFAQYYLGMTYKLLLVADQLGFIQYTIHAVSLVLNTVLCILLMQNGASMHVVKLTTSLIFILQPILLSVIARRRYHIDRTIRLTEEPIEQKWNGLAQHIASVVLGNTDTVVLTLLSTLKNVSIYAVYHLVVNGIKQIVLSMTSGMQAMFGNMLAKREMEQLTRTFDRIEWFLHTLIAFLFTITAVTIVPFVKIYTLNVTDTNYIVPAFAYMLVLAQASYCIRLPYNMMVLSAGHYKQTQSSAIIEAAINIVLSVLLVFKFGLIGVAVGTFAAMFYRTLYLANYLRKNILHRRIYHFIKHILVDALEATAVFLVIRAIPTFFVMQQNNYVAWIVLTVKATIVAGIVFIAVNCIFYWKQLRGALRRTKNKCL